MNREVHVRFWESLEVKVRRATRPLSKSKEPNWESATKLALKHIRKDTARGS